MNHAYDRAKTSVPVLLKRDRVAEAIEMLARAAASMASPGILGELPENPMPSEIYDALSNKDRPGAYRGSLLGWAAALAGKDPVQFADAHGVAFDQIFRSQVLGDIEHVLEGREPRADGSAESIEDFFLKSDEMAAFVNEHSTGPAPWSTALDPSGSLIVSDADRSVFYRLAADGAGFEVSLFTDAMSVIEGNTDEGTPVGNYQGISEAFEAILVHAELSSSVAPTA
ncbi:hypothetical protein BSY19_5321 (plasmid) [Bosea sp. RAC05]|nr:hypothetical protein BSY19_5321 [Bosea sp. RAC05]